MKNDVLKKLFYTKFMLLVTPSYKRQKYIDDLKSVVEKYAEEFDKESIDGLMEQVKLLRYKQSEKLFSTSFPLYKFLRFGNGRLEIDNYQPDDCKTFYQFNNALREAFVIMDCEENLES